MRTIRAIFLPIKRMIRRGIVLSLKIVDLLMGHQVIAKLLVYLIKQHPWNKQSSTYPGPKTICVLAFEKDIFVKDLTALSNRTSVDVILFPLLLTSRIFSMMYLPSHLQSQWGYRDHTTEKDQKAKARMLDATREILPYLQKELGFHALVVGHVDYHETQAWSYAGAEIQIPTVVFFRESVRSEVAVQTSIDFYKGLAYSFTSGKVATYNGYARQMLIDAGVCSSEQVVVTGACRTDPLAEAVANFDKLVSPTEQDTFTLFSFNRVDYKGAELWESTLVEFAKAAQQYEGQYRFVVKVRADEDKPKLIDTLKLYNLASAPLEIINHISMEDLFLRSRVFISYNSTALIESLATPLPVIMPSWFEGVTNDRSALMLPDITSPAYDTAFSPEEFRKLIDTYAGSEFTPIVSPEAKESRQQLVSRHLFRIDGKCSERVAAVIADAIADAIAD